ncbi:MAG: DUF11 domain-containing protein [Lentisphaerae bacterium]|nr:DUF11 domain-containing protein [Lentisphaerota bacterium]
MRGVHALKVMERSARGLGLIQQQSCRGNFRSRALLSAALLLTGLACLPTRAEYVAQTFLVSLPEQDVYDAFDAIEFDQSIGVNMRSIISVVISEPGTIVVYDHWEDGYESSAFSPTQTTSSVWGDGNTNNGVLAAYPTDIFGAGDIIEFDNLIPIPRDPSTIYSDGGDKISVTKPVALTRAMYPNIPGPLMAGAVQVLDTTQHGLVYRSPVGEDISYNNAFDYVGMFIMSTEDPTLVSVDTDADGSPDLQQWLNEGERIFIDGGIQVGASVSSEKPIQAHLVAGRFDGNYQVRLFTLFPRYQWTDNYITPVGSVAGDDGEAAVFLHNPHEATITVTYETSASTGTVDVLAGDSEPFIMPIGSGARFYTSDGSSFLTASTISSGAAGQAFDWGFSPVPQKSLSTMIICAWGWGSSDRSGNYNPFWVTPVADTTIYIDYDSDPSTGPLVDPLGNRYDVQQAISRLESAAIYNASENDQTRMRVYSLDGVYLSGAWGEYAGAPSPTAGTALDMGTTLMPFPAILVQKSHEIWVDVDGNGLVNPGDSLRYTLSINNYGFQTAQNVIVHDLLPGNTVYNVGTCTTNGTTTADDSVPPAATPFPLDENGLNVGSLDVGATSTVSYVITIDGAYPIDQGVLVNSVYVEASEGQRQDIDPVRVNASGLSLSKSSSATNEVAQGDTITYTITVANTGTYAHAFLRLTDVLPPELTYVTNSTVYTILTNLIQQTVRDDFSTVSYANNDGKTNWLGSWVEIGETNGPVTNFVAVGSSLGISASGVGAWRAADLSGFSNATLYLTYRRDFLTNGSQAASIDISSNGGGSWMTLETLTAVTNDPVAGVNVSYDISSYIASNTAVRFLTSGTGWSNGNDWVYFDGIEMEFTRPWSGSGSTNAGTAPPHIVTLDTLAPHTVMTVTFDATAADVITSSQLVNQASLISAVHQDPIYASVTDLVAYADIAVTKVANGAGPYSLTNSVSFTVTVTNNGLSDASNVEVTDAWPASLIFSNATPSQGSYAGSNHVWMIGDLSVGSSATLVVSGVVAVASGPSGITNSATVTGSSQYDPVVSNNTDDAVIVTLPDPSTSALGDRVWHDINGNGIQDSGEVGATGITVRVYRDLDLDGVAEPGGDDGGPLATTVTYSIGSTNGLYGFSSLPGGFYFVEFAAPTGSTFTTVDAGSDDSIDSDAGASGLTAVFLLAAGATNQTVDAGLSGDLSTSACGSTYLVADAGGGGGGNDLFTQVDRATGIEVAVGVGTGTFDIEAIAFNPIDTELFAADADELGTIDLTTGVYTTIGPFGSGTGSVGTIAFSDVDGLTFDPFTFEMYGSVRLGTEDLLIKIDPVSGSAVADAFGAGVDYVVVNAIAGHDDIDDIAIDPYDGQMYGIANSGGAGDRLVKINKQTGVATDVGLLGVDDHEGLSFSNDGELFGTTGAVGTDSLYDVEKTNGVASNQRPLTAGSDYEGSDSLTCPPNTILGTVYRDIDKDALFEAGELGQGSVTVRLYRDVNGDGLVDGGDVLLTTHVTDSSGAYQFVFASSGAFVMDIDTNSLPQDAFLTTDNLEGADFGSSVGQTDPDNDFGLAFVPSIGDRVWEDLNGSGIQDPSEPGISNVTVRLYDEQTNLLATTTTDTNGLYSFENLAASNYFVEVVAPPSFDFVDANMGSDDAVDSDIDPVSGFSSLITLASGEQDWSIDAGLSRTVSVGDYVWYDVDGDGIQDPGEPGTNGVLVLLYGDTDGDGVVEPNGDDGAPVGSTNTYNNGGTNGYYVFSGYPAGSYYIQFVLPTGMAFSVSNAGGDDSLDSDANHASGWTPIFTLTSGTYSDMWDAGIVPAISGLAITKGSDTGGVPQNPGDTIRYTITVSNTGAVTQTGVDVVDLLPPGVTYVPDSTAVAHFDITTNTVRDEFSAQVYTGNTGTVDWSTGWTDTQDGSPTAGDIQVLTDLNGPYSLRFRDDNRHIWRSVDLSGAISATLSLLYRRDSLDNSAEWVRLRAATSSAGPWSLVNQYTGPATDGAFIAANYDLSTWISSSTTIGFWNDNRGMDNFDAVWFDDIQIQYVTAGTVTNAGGAVPNLATGYTLTTGQTMTVTFDVVVDDPAGVTQLVNTATAAAVGHPPISATVTDMVATVDLAVTKTANKATSYGTNELVWFTVTVDNNGPDDATGAMLTENWPSSIVFSNAVPSQGSYDSGAHIWTIGDISVGGSASLVLTGMVNVAVGGGTITNSVAISAVDQYEPNTSNNTNSDVIVTQVLISDFEVTMENGHAVVTWQTDSEFKTLGFHLYRYDATTQAYQQLNTALLPGLLTEPQGGTYRFIDLGALAGAPLLYRIDEIELDGRRRGYGPFSVGPLPVRPLVQRTVASAAAAVLFSRQAHARSAAKKETAVSAVVSALSFPQAEAAAVGAPVRLRIEVTARAMQRLEADVIADATGLSIETVRSAIDDGSWSLTSQGREIAWRQSGEAILFYGETFESPYTHANVYWLERGVGRIMDQHMVIAQAPTGEASTFRETLTFAEDRYAPTSLFDDPDADFWVWDYLIGGHASLGSKTYPFSVPGVASGAGDAHLRVTLHGSSAAAVGLNDHHARVSINGSFVGEVQWAGLTATTLHCSVPEGTLVDGTNEIEVLALLDAGVPHSIVYLDSFEVEYARLGLAVDNAIIVHGETGVPLELGGFTGSDVSLLNVSTPSTPLIARRTGSRPFRLSLRISMTSSTMVSPIPMPFAPSWATPIARGRGPRAMSCSPGTAAMTIAM